MAIPRRPRWPVYLLLALVFLLVVAVGFVRSSVGRFSPPEVVRDKVLRLHGQVSDIYGARIGDSVILFDSGADTQGRGLDALLAKLGRSRDDVSDVFITHGHGDHIGGAGLFVKARLHGGIGDADMMAQRAPQQPRLARTMARVMRVPPVRLTDAFLDRAEVHVGSEVVTAIPLAGHTPGSMLYLYDGVLFSGDTIVFMGGKLDYSPSLFNVDGALVKKNIANLATTVDLSQVKTVCTGHGGCTPESDTQRLVADFIKRAQS